MSDMLGRVTAVLKAGRRAHFSRAVSYRRGETVIADIQATVGRTPFRVDTGHGLFEYAESRDYLIDCEDLAALGDPLRGDQVLESFADGTTQVYQVAAPGNEPCFRHSGPDRSVYRIHTNAAGAEPTEGTPTLEGT